MIIEIQRQNVQALIRQEYQPLMMIIEAYKNGEDVSEMTDDWTGFGTTGEAIKEYLENNVTKDKPKRTRKTAKEVENG